MCFDRDMYLVLFVESTSPLGVLGFFFFSYKSFTWKKTSWQFYDVQILESLLRKGTCIFSSIKMHVCAGFWESLEIMLARTWIFFHLLGKPVLPLSITLNKNNLGSIFLSSTTQFRNVFTITISTRTTMRSQVFWSQTHLTIFSCPTSAPSTWHWDSLYKGISDGMNHHGFCGNMRSAIIYFYPQGFKGAQNRHLQCKYPVSA